MRRAYLYYGSFAVFGASLAVDGLVSAASEGWTLPVAFLALTAGGLVLTSVYRGLTTDPAEFSAEAYAVFGVALAALLALLGAVLQLASYGL